MPHPHSCRDLVELLLYAEVDLWAMRRWAAMVELGFEFHLVDPKDLPPIRWVEEFVDACHRRGHVDALRAWTAAQIETKSQYILEYAKLLNSKIQRIVYFALATGMQNISHQAYPSLPRSSRSVPQTMCPAHWKNRETPRLAKKGHHPRGALRPE